MIFTGYITLFFLFLLFKYKIKTNIYIFNFCFLYLNYDGWSKPWLSGMERIMLLKKKYLHYANREENAGIVWANNRINI